MTALETWMADMVAGVIGDKPTGPQDNELRKAIDPRYDGEMPALERRIMAGLRQARAYEMRLWANRWTVEHPHNIGMMVLVRMFWEESHQLEKMAVEYGKNGIQEQPMVVPTGWDRHDVDEQED